MRNKSDFINRKIIKKTQQVQSIGSVIRILNSEPSLHKPANSFFSAALAEVLIDITIEIISEVGADK